MMTPEIWRRKNICLFVYFSISMLVTSSPMDVSLHFLHVWGSVECLLHKEWNQKFSLQFTQECKLPPLPQKEHCVVFREIDFTILYGFSVSVYGEFSSWHRFRDVMTLIIKKWENLFLTSFYIYKIWPL